ncbi:MAG: PEP-CTERM sorting domain-containing protein [Alphaproteobacteria bacterium]|nr:PEP-CTERM sorting domain-containing protein [Alphaproteobacteria bacterium]
MRRSNQLFFGIAAAGLLFGSTALTDLAQAAPLQYTGVCPSTSGHNAEGGGGTGSTSDCNLLIVFNANGSITTTGPGGAYESIEDALIGVVNNSGNTITSFNLTNPGANIFGFEGDGIDSYVNPPSGSISDNSKDSTGYGGPLVWFSNINAAKDTGTINIIGGLASGTGDVNCPQFSPNANPGTCDATYFSLEDPVSLNAPPTVVPTPEPTSLAIIGVAFAGLGLARRRYRARNG